jgi:hypothetical protein
MITYQFPALQLQQPTYRTLPVAIPVYLGIGAAVLLVKLHTLRADPAMLEDIAYCRYCLQSGHYSASFLYKAAQQQPENKHRYAEPAESSE